MYYTTTIIDEKFLITVCEVGFEQPEYTVGEADVQLMVCLVKANNAQLQQNVDVQVNTFTLGSTANKGSATGRSY